MPERDHRLVVAVAAVARRVRVERRHAALSGRERRHRPRSKHVEGPDVSVAHGIVKVGVLRPGHRKNQRRRNAETKQVKRSHLIYDAVKEAEETGRSPRQDLRNYALGREVECQRIQISAWGSTTNRLFRHRLTHRCGFCRNKRARTWDEARAHMSEKRSQTMRAEPAPAPARPPR